MKLYVQVNSYRYIKFILKNKKGSRSIYDQIVRVNEIQVTERWNRELGQVENEEWKKVQLHFKVHVY